LSEQSILFLSKDNSVPLILEKQSDTVVHCFTSFLDSLEKLQNMKFSVLFIDYAYFDTEGIISFFNSTAKKDKIDLPKVLYISRNDFGYLKKKEIELFDNIIIKEELSQEFFKYRLEQTIECWRIKRDILNQELDIIEGDERFKTIFNSIPVIMAVLSVPDREFFAVNKQFYDSLGYTRGEILGKTVEELGIFSMPEDSPYNINELKNRAHYLNVELIINRKIGDNLRVLVSAETLLYNGQDYRLLAAIDITKQKNTEEELKKINYEVSRINRLMNGREHRVIKIKKEVNTLCKDLGLSIRYRSVE